MNIHLCGPLSSDKLCRQYGVPRLHIHEVFGRDIIVALWPSGKVHDNRTDRFRWVATHLNQQEV